jgi:hypothetical protein
VSRTVACGWTDGHETESRFSEFYERASKQRNVTGPLTRKGTGPPEVLLDARQTLPRLTPDSRTVNIRHILACHMNPSITQQRLAASLVFFPHAGIPLSTSFSEKCQETRNSIACII